MRALGVGARRGLSRHPYRCAEIFAGLHSIGARDKLEGPELRQLAPIRRIRDAEPTISAR